MFSLARQRAVVCAFTVIVLSVAALPAAAQARSLSHATAHSQGHTKKHRTGCLVCVGGSGLNLGSVSVIGALSSGQVNQAYSAQLYASGGWSGYQWAVSAGSLPQGLTLGSTGLISGTPSKAGGSWFEVKVTDAAGATGVGDFGIWIGG